MHSGLNQVVIESQYAIALTEKATNKGSQYETKGLPHLFQRL